MTTSTTAPATARSLWELLEPIHAVTYFSPEPLAALRDAGCRGFWMGYFAGRAAPLGTASPELVHAIFANFAPEHVARALPDAWEHTTPEAALRARADGSVAALARMLGPSADEPAVARAAGLLARAGASAAPEGRPLYAANRALAVPEAPLDRLWHAATLLREHRGDGHVAALVATGVGGRESHVLHALATGTSADVYATARHLGEDEWRALLAALDERGLTSEGALTDRGRALKRQVEDLTDTLAAPAYDVLTETETRDLLATLRPLRDAVVSSGDIPLQSPMGLDLRPHA